MAQCNDIKPKGQWNAITYGFKVGAPQAIDDRLVLTKEEMRNISDDRMPETYMATCTEDGSLYIYNKHNSYEGNPDQTGRFRLFNEGRVVDVQVNGESVVDELTKVANVTSPLEVVDGLLHCTYDADVDEALVRVVSDPILGGTVSGGGTYEIGSTAVLTAAPNIGYEFVKWSNGCTTLVNSVLVRGDITHTALFKQLEGVRITVEASDPVKGTVSANPEVIYSGGESVIVAIPNPGYTFAYWSDGGAQAHTVSPTDDTTYIATFI